MRFALIIVMMVSIAVGLVHIRLEENSVGNEVQRLQQEHKSLRRRLWDQQVRLSRLTAPEAVRKRMQYMQGSADGPETGSVTAVDPTEEE